jgi:hypothetical protein
MFWAMAGLSGLTCVVMATSAIEPRSLQRKVADGRKASADKMADGDEGEAAGEAGKDSAPVLLGRMWGRLKHIMWGVAVVFKTPSFLLILVGNVISTVVGLGMGYKILYLQVRHGCPQPACCACSDASALSH